MHTDAYLIKAIANIPHYWPRIDKKYDELKNIKLKRTNKSLSVINELPPKSLLRAIKLLAIIEVLGMDGVNFVTDLFERIFRREIEFCEKQGNELTFENFLATFGKLNDTTNDILTTAAVYLHVRKCMGLPADNSELLQEIVSSATNDWYDYAPSSAAMKKVAKWMNDNGNPNTLNLLSYNEALFDDDLQVFAEITKKENIPARAYEHYQITRKDLAYFFEAVDNEPFFTNINNGIALAYMFTSLAKYAEECKTAYLDLALSPQVSPNYKLKKELAEKENALKLAQSLCDDKQEKLNLLQQKFDRLQKSFDVQSEELSLLKDLTANIAKSAEQEEETTNPDSVSEQLPDLTNFKIVVFGGAPSWQIKIRQLSKNITCIEPEDKGFDISILKTADLVVINYIYINHAQVMRLKTVTPEEKILYIGTNNVQHFINILSKKIKNIKNLYENN